MESPLLAPAPAVLVVLPRQPGLGSMWMSKSIHAFGLPATSSESVSPIAAASTSDAASRAASRATWWRTRFYHTRVSDSCTSEREEALNCCAPDACEGSLCGADGSGPACRCVKSPLLGQVVVRKIRSVARVDWEGVYASGKVPRGVYTAAAGHQERLAACCFQEPRGALPSAGLRFEPSEVEGVLFRRAGVWGVGVRGRRGGLFSGATTCSSIIFNRLV